MYEYIDFEGGEIELTYKVCLSLKTNSYYKVCTKVR